MSPMRGRPVGRAALLAAALALAACAGTRLVESWVAPGAGPLQFKKVLALAVVKDDSLRRTAEDSLAASILKATAVPSYKLLTWADLDDRERVKALLKKEGFDGVVTLRMAGAREELSWAPTPYPGGSTFWGFYTYAYTPADMVSDTVVRVEISVYSLTEDKLLWSGVSETLNSNDTTNLVHAIARAAAEDLRRRGLLG